MHYLLLFLSVSVNAAYSSLHNLLGKKRIRCAWDNYIINALTYGVGSVLLLALAAFTWEGISGATVLMGLLFGLVTALGGLFQLKALSCGPMSFTVLITTSSMILPAFSGAVFWQEELSPFKVLGTALMITAAYFTAVRGGGKTSLKWLGCSMAGFLATGAIGIMQKFQQNSAYASQSTPFLAIAFLTATLICCIAAAVAAPAKDSREPIRFKSTVLPSALCGGFIVFLNVVNLYLAGVLPSALMFPVQNGGTTVLSVLCAIILFREPLNRKKIIGLAIGMVALVLLLI